VVSLIYSKLNDSLNYDANLFSKVTLSGMLNASETD